METPKVLFKKINPEASKPSYAKPGDSGADLVYTPMYAGTEAVFQPGDIKILPTGLAIQLPEGWEAQVRSRSGNASRGLAVLNSPGTVDSGYRGEIKVILHYVGNTTCTVKPGDRIAQLVVAPSTQANFTQVDELASSERGSDGFGSSGH